MYPCEPSFFLRHIIHPSHPRFGLIPPIPLMPTTLTPLYA